MHWETQNKTYKTRNDTQGQYINNDTSFKRVSVCKYVCESVCKGCVNVPQPTKCHIKNKYLILSKRSHNVLSCVFVSVCKFLWLNFVCLIVSLSLRVRKSKNLVIINCKCVCKCKYESNFDCGCKIAFLFVFTSIWLILFMSLYITQFPICLSLCVSLCVNDTSRWWV